MSAQPSLIKFYESSDVGALRTAQALVGRLPRAESNREAQADRWTQLELPFRLLHPNMLAAIAKELQWTESEVRMVLTEQAWAESGRCIFPPGHPGDELGIQMDCWPGAQRLARSEMEPARRLWAELGLDEKTLLADDGKWRDTAYDRSGIGAFDNLLPDRLFVRAVPLPPANSVPERAAPALRAFVGYLDRAKQILEHAVVPLVRQSLRSELQQSLMTLLQSWTETEPAQGRPLLWEPEPPRNHLPHKHEYSDFLDVSPPATPRAAFVDGQSLVLDYPSVTVLFSPSGCTSLCESRGADLVGISAGLLRYSGLVYEGPMYWDRAASKWLAHHPTSACLVVDLSAESEQAEKLRRLGVPMPTSARLSNMQTSRQFKIYACPNGFGGVRYSKEGRFVAVEGEEEWFILDEHGDNIGGLKPYEVVPHISDRLTIDGTLEKGIEVDELPDEMAFAFNVQNGRLLWFVINRLWVGQRCLLGLDFPVFAAAFSDDGQRLAAVTDQNVIWIDIATLEIVATWTLPEISVPGGQGVL